MILHQTKLIIFIKITLRLKFWTVHCKQRKPITYFFQDNPEATVGFRVEFLHLNVLKECGEEVETKAQPVFLSETCDPVAETEVIRLHQPETTYLGYS